MIYTKRWHVARLFFGDELGELEVPKDSKWHPINEILPARSVNLIWAKNSRGDVFKVFHFSKYPYFYYASHLELAEDITHFAKFDVKINQQKDVSK